MLNKIEYFYLIVSLGTRFEVLNVVLEESRIHIGTQCQVKKNIS